MEDLFYCKNVMCEELFSRKAIFISIKEIRWISKEQKNYIVTYIYKKG